MGHKESLLTLIDQKKIKDCLCIFQLLEPWPLNAKLGINSTGTDVPKLVERSFHLRRATQQQFTKHKVKPVPTELLSLSNDQFDPDPLCSVAGKFALMTAFFNVLKNARAMKKANHKPMPSLTKQTVLFPSTRKISSQACVILKEN